MADQAHDHAKTTKRPCPRCDYDLSGEVDSWTTQCPLEGRCPECGLDYEWRNVLNPRLTVPKWSFEHKGMTQQSVFRCRLSTVLMTFRPWRLWRELRMEQPFHLARLVELAVLVPLLALFVLLFVNALNYYYLQSQGLEYILSGLRYILVDHQPPQPQWQDDLFQICYPFGTQSIFQSTSTPWEWLALTVIWATLVPLSYVVLRQSRRMCHVSIRHLIRVAVYSMPVIGALIIIQLSAMAARSRMSPLYWRRWFGGWKYEAIEFVQNPAFIFLVSCFGLLVWWFIATRCYLKLPHAGAVSICMVTIGLLASFAFVSYSFGQQLLVDIAAMFTEALLP